MSEEEKPLTKEEQEALMEYLLLNSKSLEPEYAALVSKKFSELLA